MKKKRVRVEDCPHFEEEHIALVRRIRTSYYKVKKALGAKFVRFDGSDYEPKYDDIRLTGQIMRVFELMKDAQWRTYDEISDVTGDPQPSISAQLRHLRKKRFGAHTVNKRSRGDREHGLFEYQLLVRGMK